MLKEVIFSSQIKSQQNKNWKVSNARNNAPSEHSRAIAGAPPVAPK